MVFDKLKLKNFLSYGNQLTTFDFNAGKVVTILGKNGQGKSTILEAIYFTLTGKPLRNINKNKLINSTNKKDCYVELLFSIGNSEYVVKRGIKPNIFEIYKDGNLIDEESHVKDYQLVLESITGMTTKVIEQILIISNRFYKPFLELSAAEKRGFTETVFGTNVLSELNDKLKIRLGSIKEKIPLLEKDIERIQSNITILNEKPVAKVDVNNLLVLIENNSQLLLNKETQRDTIKAKVNEVTNKKTKLEKSLSEYDIILGKKCKCEVEIDKCNTECNYNSSVCGYCGHELDKEVVEQKRIKILETKSVWENRLNKINKKLETLSKYKLSYTECCNELKILNDEYQSLTLEIMNLKYENDTHKKTINTQKQIDKDIEAKVVKLNNQKNKFIGQLNELKKNQQAVVLLQKMLSEKGLRKYIFSKYITLLNVVVNRYLTKLGADYQIKIDDEFNDEIVGRGHNQLNFASLSSGEKQRLDLSLMFGFLEIAKMRNDVNSNLLCFDEMFSDIDNEGLNGVNEIFNEMKLDNKCVLLNTHDDRIKELSDISYAVKKNKFSRIERI